MIKRNKYGNREVKIDGIRFDSMKEANRYQELRMLEKAGEIFDLRRHVKYELIPPQYKTDANHKKKLIERKCLYVADFDYVDKDGVLHVEDVKGYRDASSAGYAKFVIKRKLMLHLYGIKVEEV